MKRSTLLFALFFSTIALADDRYASLRQAIEGGQIDGRYPAVGRVIITELEGEATCTGTLIAPDAVLTAAHCIARPEAMSFEVTDPEDATTTLRSFGARVALAHPEFAHEKTDTQLLQSRNDIGVLLLEEAVPGELATPLPLYRKPVTSDFHGKPVLALGYGQTMTEPAGTKRSVTLLVSAPNEYTYMQIPSAPIEEQANQSICSGDSGGPDLFAEDGVEALIGVHSIGAGKCGMGQSSRVDVHLENFIEPILAGEVPAGCEGSSLDEAVCHADLESSGCGCSAAGFSPVAIVPWFLMVLALRSRSRRHDRVADRLRSR